MNIGGASMYYAKLSKSLCSFNLSLIFVLSIITNVVADDVVTYADGTVPVYYNAEMTPDEAYRQLVAGNARYLKEDSVAAQALPRLATARKGRWARWWGNFCRAAHTPCRRRA